MSILDNWHIKEPLKLWDRLHNDDICTSDNEVNHNTIETWDELYNTTMPPWLGWGIHDLIANEIEDGMRILDVGGCGGQGATKIMDALSNSRITVLDLSEVAINYGRNRYSNIEFICADYYDYHTDEKFDIVIASQFLEHFDDIVFIMMKLMSMVRVGGTLYIGVPHEDDLYVWHQHRFTHDSFHFFQSFSNWVSFRSDGALLGGNADCAEELNMLVKLVKDDAQPRRAMRRILMENGKSPVALYFPTNQPIYGGNYNEVAMGGAETNGMMLAEALTDKYTVYVFAPCQSHDYNNVHYVNIDDFKYYTHLIDTVIISGTYMHTYVLRGIMHDIPNVIIWSHVVGAPNVTQEDMDIVYDKVDLELFMSQWHLDGYCSEMMRVNDIDMNRYRDKFIVLPGYFPSKYVKVPPRKDRKKHMVYTSMPVRGLHTFDRILPRIKERCPDLVLHTYSSHTIYHDLQYKNIYPQDEVDLKELLSQHGNVVHHDLVPMTELIDIIADSLLFVLPSYMCETMCVGIVQAMRCGTPVITSGHSGLTETNGNGPYLVPIPDAINDANLLYKYVHSDEYVDKFVDNIIRLYNDEDSWNEESRRCVEVSAKYDMANCVSVISDFIDR